MNMCKIAAMAAFAALALPVRAQFVTFPEISSDRHTNFRIMAAQPVRLNTGDIPGAGIARLTRGTNSVWEVTVGPVPAAAYHNSSNPRLFY